MESHRRDQSLPSFPLPQLWRERSWDKGSSYHLRPSPCSPSSSTSLLFLGLSYRAAHSLSLPPIHLSLSLSLTRNKSSWPLIGWVGTGARAHIPRPHTHAAHAHTTPLLPLLGVSARYSPPLQMSVPQHHIPSPFPTTIKQHFYLYLSSHRTRHLLVPGPF